jgi:hypothetical protein
MKKVSADTIQVRLSDLWALWVNLTLGASDPSIGFHDTEHSLSEMKKYLDRTVHLPISIVESALWSSNLRYEKDEFEHPEGLTFPEFVRRIAGDKHQFDYYFNLLEERKEK